MLFAHPRNPGVPTGSTLSRASRGWGALHYAGAKSAPAPGSGVVAFEMILESFLSGSREMRIGLEPVGGAAQKGFRQGSSPVVLRHQSRRRVIPKEKRGRRTNRHPLLFNPAIWISAS